MPDRPSRSTGDAQGFAYPGDLARFVQDRWATVQSAAPYTSPPDLGTLEQLLSACYQASLMREEERPVTFRAILAPPDMFLLDGMPPESPQRRAFCTSFRLDPSELRRLSVAADMQRTLIGVHRDADGALRIWGLVNSGPRWLREVRGGRRAGAPLPPVPIVHVDAPGRIALYSGQTLIGKLQSGHLTGARTDVFTSTWLPEQFIEFGHELRARHLQARQAANAPWAPLAPGLPREIADRMLKRAIALLRDARHGGTIVFVPAEHVRDLRTADPFVDLKYTFEPPRQSFADVVVSILNRLAAVHGAGPRAPEPVSWQDFETTCDNVLVTLDEALFETAHLIASLASADGAVVMSKHHDVLGFGGMISGRLSAVRRVARALDIDANIVAEEGTENVGARHRSAYRLAGALPGAVVIVVSQDGGARFVAKKDGQVTFWEQE